MKLAIVADLHGNLPPMPTGVDAVLIAGDICPADNHHLSFQEGWLRNAFRPWLLGLDLPPERIIAVAGNHDLIFERWPVLVPDLPWTYLQDSGTSVDGLEIWGSPHQPKFFDWAFNRTEEQLAAAWQLIPPTSDVLLLHGPPQGCGDWSSYDRTHCGSPSLRARIEELQPKLVCCGHIHAGYGQYHIGETLVVNAAHCDDHYRPVNPPIVVDL